MAKAAAAPAPWGEGFEGNPFRRFTIKQQKAAGLRNFGKGWISQDVWDKMPKHPKMSEYTLPNGTKVKMIDGDYDKYIGFQRPDKNKTVAMLEEISDAFNLAESERGKKGSKKKPLGVQHRDGVGHINWLEYNPRRQIMMVEFNTDQAIVVYFQVPENVWRVLAYHAESGGMRYDGKHLLGIEFWNYIRIRGQVTGSRYRYVYTQDGNSITGAISTDGGAPITLKQKKEVERKEKEQPQSASGKMNRNSLVAYARSHGTPAARLAKMSDDELKAHVNKLREDV
jgi:hypothetical protein